MSAARPDHWTAPALMLPLALLLAVLAGYGLFSLPELAARWGVSGEGMAVLLTWCATAGWALGVAIRRPARGEWVAFALVALAWRVASLMLAEPRVSPGDSHWYLVLAGHVLGGRGLVLDDPYMHLPIRALYPPLYPLLLAGWTGVAGTGPWSLLGLSTLLDLSTAWLISRLGERLGIGRAAVAAAALYLVWPSTLFDAPLAQKESLELLLVVALALGWIEAWRNYRERWRNTLAIGLCAGLLALTQPGLVMLAPLFGIALLPRLGLRRLLSVGAPAAIVAVLVMLPWWWRNWTIFGRFVPLTSAAGLSLWVGNNPGATGNWMAYPEGLRAANELYYSKAAGRLALDWMTQHPSAAARLTLAKFVRAMGLSQSGVVRLAGMQPALGPRATAALLLTEHFAHVALLIGGATALTRSRGQAVLAILIAACVAQLMVFGVWFEFGERHRMFLTPFLLLLAASGFAGFRRRTAPIASVSALPVA